MRPFVVGNPCGYGHCMRVDCEKCPAWKPVIYIGKNYREIRLPKWNWLVMLLYRIEEKLGYHFCCSGCDKKREGKI